MIQNTQSQASTFLFANVVPAKINPTVATFNTGTIAPARTANVNYHAPPQASNKASFHIGIKNQVVAKSFQNLG